MAAKLLVTETTYSDQHHARLKKYSWHIKHYSSPSLKNISNTTKINFQGNVLDFRQTSHHGALFKTKFLATTLILKMHTITRHNIPKGVTFLPRKVTTWKRTKHSTLKKKKKINGDVIFINDLILVTDSFIWNAFHFDIMNHGT